MGEIRAQDPVRDGGAVGRQRKGQRRARIPMPDFRSIHPMPVRDLAFGEEVIDRRPRRAFVRCGVGAPGLAIPAAFGVGLQFQRGDDVVGGHGLSSLMPVGNCLPSGAGPGQRADRGRCPRLPM